MTNDRPYAHSDFDDRHLATKQLLGYFTWANLPDQLRPISAELADVAFSMTNQLADGPELEDGLTKLLGAKDAFVRAMVTQTDTKP